MGGLRCAGSTSEAAGAGVALTTTTQHADGHFILGKATDALFWSAHATGAREQCSLLADEQTASSR